MNRKNGKKNGHQPLSTKTELYTPATSLGTPVQLLKLVKWSRSPEVQTKH